MENHNYGISWIQFICKKFSGSAGDAKTKSKSNVLYCLFISQIDKWVCDLAVTWLHKHAFKHTFNSKPLSSGNLCPSFPGSLW